MYGEWTDFVISLSLISLVTIYDNEYALIIDIYFYEYFL